MAAGGADCLFCGIVAKKIPATIVAEGEHAIAFRDIHPGAPVHVLVIPKVHITNLMSLEPTHREILVDIHATVQKVARAEGVSEKGFRTVVNNGKDSGQAVGHLHYHVLAGRKLNWPPG
jgi:histidine triad (HIT) family protein